MEQYSYTPRGVCARQITFEVENGIVKNVKFLGGCSGNTQGISSLVEGMEINDVIKRLRGTDCNGKRTSCPDQLAKALELVLNE